MVRAEHDLLRERLNQSMCKLFTARSEASSPQQRDLSRNTLAASIVRVGREVQPIVNLLRDHLLDSPLLHGDETHAQVLKEASKSAQSKSYMWVQMTPGCGVQGQGPPIRLFGYAPSRTTAAAQILYAGVRAGSVLMTDDYSVYDAIAQAYGLVHLGCWAHCRRGFHEALQALPKRARAAPGSPLRGFSRSSPSCMRWSRAPASAGSRPRSYWPNGNSTAYPCLTR